MSKIRKNYNKSVEKNMRIIVSKKHENNRKYRKSSIEKNLK